MGKQSGKKKQTGEQQYADGNVKQSKVGDNSPRAYDKDAAVFISMANELKEEGNKMFQKRDYEGAMVKYEKAIKMLPRNHIDVSYLRSNMAACYMQLGLREYPRAIHECNLALEVTPKYSKALIKRARCYEALNRLDLALRDVSTVLKVEPNNLMALEISDRVKRTLENKGLRVNDTVIELPPEYVEPLSALPALEVVKEKTPKKKKKKKKNNVGEQKAVDDIVENKADDDAVEKRDEDEAVEKKAGQKIKKKKAEESIEEKKAEDKVVVEEKISSKNVEEPKRTVKLVFGEDIRWAQLPLNCSLLQLREVIRERFPSSRAVLIKYRDQEGDLVTITTDEELRWAEAAAESQGSVRLYIVEVNSQQDPFFDRLGNKEVPTHHIQEKNVAMNGDISHAKETRKGSYYIDEWIVEFAQLFKNHVGFDSDAYLNLHELGIKVYSEAMEETVTSEEAQDLFNRAAEKFQEMAALAFFNWGNVHMSRARKKLSFPEDASREFVREQIKTTYDWAQREYTKAGQTYEEALRIKPDFYEALLALGQQQFEQAKLSWYYALGTHVDLETWPSTQVLQLYNNAEENMDKGMQMWEELEGQQFNEIYRLKKVKSLPHKREFDSLFEDTTCADEALAEVSNMKSQINLLWGTILYERSIMEYKLGLPVWQECLEIAVEKFELAGASPTDIAVMIKNHCSNNNALQGLSFRIDEIVQSWKEMCEAKKWKPGVPSFRLEPLLRRRVSKLCHALEIA